MWPSRAGLALGALLLLGTGCLGRPGGEDWRLCLPPVFEGGQRLHQLPTGTVFWLELLLRQHEVCWRRPERPDEKRVFLLGSSSVFGFPLPAERTFAASINRYFEQGDQSLHVYNLAMNFPYQLKDALILEAALPYKPDLILYPLTLAEFSHYAPGPWPAQVRLFQTNYDLALRFLETSPPGLTDPLARYRSRLTTPGFFLHYWHRLRNIGGFLRVATGQWALTHSVHLTGTWPVIPPPKPKPYECADTLLDNRQRFRDWSTWNILEYLHHIQQDHGIPVAIVHWPIAHAPQGDCYNARFSTVHVQQFHEWIREQAHSLRFRFLDLKDALGARSFSDTVHLNQHGHRRLAQLLIPFVKDSLRPATASHRRPSRDK